MNKRQPRVLIIDVDGVMTDGKFHYSAEGKQLKVFGADDHDALGLLAPHLEIVFVTGDKRGFAISSARIVQDMKMRLELVSTIERVEWIRERWALEDVIYIGDGIFDHYVFKEVGYSIAPANADAYAKSCVDYVTKRLGGDRAVAEASLHILEKFFVAYDRTKKPSSQLSLSGQWSSKPQKKMGKKITALIELRARPATNLRQYLSAHQHPVLCVGPMSKNCVDAIIGFANAQARPIPIIASRRQIECSELGAGYVNNWDTRTFAEYVAFRDRGFVPLCRDHGGPWQGNSEASLSQAEAMRRAKLSLLEDIVAGFEVLHLDPSLESHAANSPEVIEMLFELYSYVIETARRLGRQVEIEIGAEQQSGYFSDPHELINLLEQVSQFCQKRNFQLPLFCVVQTGTLVREMRNVGMTEGRRNEAYDQKFAVESMERTVSKLAEITSQYGIFVKEHNADYLSDGSLGLRRRLNIGAVNIAPQLGVCETKALVAICNELSLQRECQTLLDLFYSSKKWEKWTSRDGRASDFDKAIIAGHYSFSDPRFSEIHEKILLKARARGIELDTYLRTQVTALLHQLTWNLGYFQQNFGMKTKVSSKVNATSKNENSNSDTRR